ncbi:hypothetical protein HLH26_08865 [Gluconacetobacter sp. 1b LMG 1731]|uniref:Lipoprotein n=1 Tax=Gluconacetobacter dulcium TaxID=2729096 RepID=A0A7W4NSH2_9PROT|nr:hypothetical protein [Gluconacetobacter dulcium]MBB2164651.1 hypothetical protein [Gluconacetobacter dulcium]MBB2193787.1 hypothetical protein [Gluconacetobacter dulcium]
MTKKFILAASLPILAACSPGQPHRLPPATGSVVPQPVSVPQPVIIPGNYVPTGPDDGDNTDDDWAN